MTEAEWLACTEPAPMLDFLQHLASERQLRLFAVACCRLVWYLLATDACRHAVDVAERAADGEASAAELGVAHGAIVTTRRTPGGIPHYTEGRRRAAYDAAWYTSEREMWRFKEVADSVQTLAVRPGVSAEVCHLIRDVFGNPFSPTKLVPVRLDWNDGTIIKLAQAIYRDHAFDRLPILADALEEAGCADAALLDHCRGPGPHVRGCWVVDLLLSKDR